MGRKPKGKKERFENINAKVTHSEGQIIRALVEREGFRNLSEYVRVLLFRRAAEVGLIKGKEPDKTG